MLFERLLEVDGMERSDGALSCFKKSGTCPASCRTGRPCSMLIRIGPVFGDSNLLGRGAMVDSGRSFFSASLWSEPDEYAESGGGVDFSASCVPSSGTGKCFIRLERRLANPVLCHRVSYGLLREPANSPFH